MAREIEIRLGNLKINGYDSLQKIIYSVHRGKDVLSHKIV